MQSLLETLRRHGQADLADYLVRADQAARERIVRELSAIDLDEYFAVLSTVDQGAGAPTGEPEAHEVVRRAGLNQRRYGSIGAASIASGELAFFVVAGGQGSRLGFEHPKGMFPIGTLSQRTLFQIHLEKAAGFGRYYGFEPHFFIMTSSTNHDETVAYLQEHRFFGLKESHVHVFQQGNLPAADENNRLILATEDSLFLAPDGHGGALRALARHGMLDVMRSAGIRYLSYFQVDNPLVNFCDPVFLGLHLDSGSQISTKVIRKRDALEKLGNPVVVDGRPIVIEYSDLPLELARKSTPSGELVFGFGSIGIHVFDVDFIRRLTSGDLRLPFHKAVKAIPSFDVTSGKRVTPVKPNGKKLEQFVFDAIPLAERVLFFETDRSREFAPLKNKDGEDSIATCRAGQTECFRKWAETAGFDVSKVRELEISPSFASCEEEFCEKGPKLLKALPEKLFVG